MLECCTHHWEMASPLSLISVYTLKQRSWRISVLVLAMKRQNVWNKEGPARTWFRKGCCCDGRSLCVWLSRVIADAPESTWTDPTGVGWKDRTKKSSGKQVQLNVSAKESIILILITVVMIILSHQRQFLVFLPSQFVYLQKGGLLVLNSSLESSLLWKIRKTSYSDVLACSWALWTPGQKSQFKFPKALGSTPPEVKHLHSLWSTSFWIIQMKVLLKNWLKFCYLRTYGS